MRRESVSQHLPGDGPRTGADGSFPGTCRTTDPTNGADGSFPGTCRTTTPETHADRVVSQHLPGNDPGTQRRMADCGTEAVISVPSGRRSSDLSGSGPVSTGP